MKKGSKSEFYAEHGLSKHPLYRKWCDMKKRCYNPNTERYKSYGALGIKVCEEWRTDFSAFYHWSLLTGWQKGLTIERLDVNLDYSPSNCKYIPYSEQCYNKKNTLFVEWEGEVLSLSRLCKNLGLTNADYKKVWHHYRKTGKTLEESLTIIRKRLRN